MAKRKRFNSKTKVSKLFNMETENKPGPTDHLTKEDGLMDYNKEKEFKSGQKVIFNTPDLGTKVLRTASEHKLGTTAHPMKVSGKVTTWKVKVLTDGLTVESIQVPG